jgi:hypothetical protein
MEKITEATSIMGAAITAQKINHQRSGGFFSASTSEEFRKYGLDLSDCKYFTYETKPYGQAFKVFAVTTKKFSEKTGWILYNSAEPKGQRWSSDGEIIPMKALPGA